jgi:tetratricopeptide (TPR) repeat protein
MSEMEYANSLFNRAVYLYDEHRLKEALTIFEELLANHSHYFEIWNLYQWIALSYVYLDTYDKAIDYLNLALERIDRKDNGLNYLIILEKLAYSYYRIDNEEKAIDLYEKAENYIEHYSGNEWRIAKYLFYLNMGRCYGFLARNEDALKCFMKAQRITRDLGSSEEDAGRRSLLKLEIGRTYISLQKPDKAAEYLNNLDLSTLEEEDVAEYYYHMGRLYIQTEEYENAFRAFQSSLDKGIGNHFKSELFTLMGIAYFRCSKYSEAKKYFLESMKHPINQNWIVEKNEEFLRGLESLS